jgi:hypothetical protein
VIQEPVQPTITETPPTRPSRRRPGNAVIALVILACLALAVPIVGVIAASRAQAPTTAVGASPAPGASKEPNDQHPNGKIKGNNGNNGNGFGNGKAKGLKGNGGVGRGGPITITSVNGSSVSLKTDDGWTRTIVVTGTTVITKGGQTIAVGDLKAGDIVRFHQVHNTDGTYTVDAITVPTPTAGGEVTAVGSTSITVKKGGSTRVITVTGSTVYTKGKSAGTKADVKVGSEIRAQGTVSGDAFTATAVKVELPSIGGSVTAKTSTTITIKKNDGTTATIHVSGATTYELKGKDNAALTDVAVGDRLSAEGDLRADGSLDAVTVEGKGLKGAPGHDNDQGDDTPDAPASATPG